MITKIGWGFGRCNQHCRHCYNASSWAAPSHSLKQLVTIADKICPTITDINYGTGEFAVNPNALELARHIDQSYPPLKQALTTNGSSVLYLTDVDLHRFHDIDISLDFPQAERHCEFRRHPQAWTWAMTALDKLTRLGIARTIVTCVTSLTTDDDIKKLLAIASRYQSYWRLNWFRQVGRGGADLRISAKRAWQIIQNIAREGNFLALDSVFAGPFGLPVPACTAGRATCRIHEDLDTSPYPFLKGSEWSGGNIAKPTVNLKTIYQSPAFTRLRERAPTICQDCSYWPICHGGCATRAILHSSFDQPDDFCPIIGKVKPNLVDPTGIKLEPATDLVHNGYLCTTILKPHGVK